MVGSRPVVHVADERKETSLDAYFATLRPEQLAGIQAAAMDMWERYANSVRAHLENPEHRIVFDRHHVIAHMGTAVDTVRRGREPPAAGRG